MSGASSSWGMADRSPWRDDLQIAGPPIDDRNCRAAVMRFSPGQGICYRLAVGGTDVLRCAVGVNDEPADRHDPRIARIELFEMKIIEMQQEGYIAAG